VLIFHRPDALSVSQPSNNVKALKGCYTVYTVRHIVSPRAQLVIQCFDAVGWVTEKVSGM